MQKNNEDQGTPIQEPNMQGGNCTDPRGDGEVREVLEFNFTPDPSQEIAVDIEELMAIAFARSRRLGPARISFYERDENGKLFFYDAMQDSDWRRLSGEGEESK